VKGSFFLLCWISKVWHAIEDLDGVQEQLRQMLRPLLWNLT
jgi:hypothetical protein